MSSTHTVLHDPEGRIDGELPLDRETHQCLATAVLAWTADPGLETADYQQIALLLTGAARAVAADVRRAAAHLPEDHPARALADLVLQETDQHLSTGLEGTAHCVQRRARHVRALYERLDRLAKTARPELAGAHGGE
uniref:restriction endonuclease n=1 Tax=Streptomyces sp. bgisy060 TaxID=3413775 RepID=UPI003EBD96FA